MSSNKIRSPGPFTGPFLSALGLKYSSTGDVRLKCKADCSLVWAKNSAYWEIWDTLDAFPETFIDRIEAEEPVIGY